MEETYKKGNPQSVSEGLSFSENPYEIGLLAAQAHRAFIEGSIPLSRAKEYLNEERLAKRPGNP